MTSHRQPVAPSLHFKISSALKRVIGRDLITDEFVAIFELVKNSFDAQASLVDIVFEENKIFIIDNGKGMSIDDITEKWLFVAYSAKKDGTEDSGDYRDRIGEHRPYAGSKGVGRFSCDRLGQTLRMQTRRTDSPVQIITVNWDLFETDSKEEFTTVPVDHSSASHFDLPAKTPPISTGTALEIGNLREDWSREKLLRLRAALAKLINPFQDTSETFKINITALHEAEPDIAATQKNKDKPEETPIPIVNGPIHNFIFNTLSGKTTHLEVCVSADGNNIQSTLTDRGTLIYSIREPNKFPLLAGSAFTCNLFYLNRSAKQTFAQRMGVPSIKFGSVFLFKNGFRIFPIGEEGVDTFGIDRRKQQGYARFLGSRDIIGRIDVSGSDENFRESTSRNQGLIDTPAYRQLADCFDEKCLRRLERYVVGVNWRDALDLNVEDASRLHGDQASARITAIVAQLAGTEGIELTKYNSDLVRILNERSESFMDNISGLRTLAERSGDAELQAEIEAAAARFANLQRAEAAARETAERERVARREAERTAAEAAKLAESISIDFNEERKRNLFLTSLSSLDKEVIEILHHQIIIHAAAINEIINIQFDSFRDKIVPSREDLISTFENISFQNKKILSIARFATKANFRLDSETIEDDLVTYFIDYINEVAPMFSDTGIKIQSISSAKSLIRRFKPIEISILVDNLVSNAGKADASEIIFLLDQPTPKELMITVKDNGRGFSSRITEHERIFEKGFTTSTSGSGLGLYHVSQILDDLGGSITPEIPDHGAQFIIRIRG